MNSIFARAALMALLLAGPALAQEQGAVQQGTVDIESNEMEILENAKQAIFRGDVVAKRPSDTIRCQEMLVSYTDAQKQGSSSSTDIEKIDCKGAVSIKTESQDITGNKAEFFLLKEELVVTGNVTVVQGKTVLKGPQLFVDLKTRRTRMTGGRVKGKFVPK